MVTGRQTCGRESEVMQLIHQYAIDWTLQTLAQPCVSFDGLIGIALRWQTGGDWPPADGCDDQGYPWFYSDTAHRWLNEQVQRRYGNVG